MDECHNATPTMWQLVPASSRTSTTLFSTNWPNAREYKEKLPITNLECWSRMIATNKWGLTSILQNKIWSLPDQSIILPKFIKKESLPDQRKFCVRVRGPALILKTGLEICATTTSETQPSCAAFAKLYSSTSANNSILADFQYISMPKKTKQKKQTNWTLAIK